MYAIRSYYAFYVMLHAPFMAAIQIMVYAGAIMVLILFVIMLLNLGTITKARISHCLVGGGVLGGILLLQILHFLYKGSSYNFV